jgi:uncharacterized protein YlxW (UPF0749 family)
MRLMLLLRTKPQLDQNASCLLQAERRLAEEVERVKNYLDESTEPKITRVAEHELITVQVRAGAGAAVGVGVGVCGWPCEFTGTCQALCMLYT